MGFSQTMCNRSTTSIPGIKGMMWLRDLAFLEDFTHITCMVPFMESRHVQGNTVVLYPSRRTSVCCAIENFVAPAKNKICSSPGN